MALRVASRFRTVSRDAAHVVSGITPIETLAEEQGNMYQHRSQKQPDADDCRKRGRQKSLQRWQAQWDNSKRGRWTHQLIPHIAKWVNRQHGDPCYCLTQMLTGHGCFRKYLYKYKHEDSPEYPTCRGIEDARHVFFACPRFELQRRKLESALDEATTPENLVQQMLALKAAWHATIDFAKEVIEELRKEEKKRNEQRARSTGRQAMEQEAPYTDSEERRCLG